MAESSVSHAGVADRYATALFDLALEQGSIDAVAGDLDTLAEAIDQSADLRSVIQSPLYSREQQGKAVGAVASSLGLGKLTANIVGVMASKRRLFVLRDMIVLFRRRVAEHRGEVTAEVTAARPLTAPQQEALAAKLKGALSREVKLDITVDETIIGGLVVRVGSRMVDTSIRSQLNRLQNSMREAG